MPRVYRNGLRRRTDSTDPIKDALAGLTGSERVLQFFRTFLKHIHGDLRGHAFEPLAFQKAFIRAVYDPTLADGRRRVREALLMLPRKNGKSALCAGLGLYHTFAGEWGGQIIAAANSREQAGLLFTAAADMLQLAPILRSRSLVSRSVKRITDTSSRSVFRAIAAEAGTAHGMNCSLWLYDELHMAKNSELIDALRTSVGARSEPLGIVISTAGFDKLSPLGLLYDHGKRWLEDPSIDPSFSATIYEASEDDAWDDPAVWRKTNPAAGAFRSLEELATAAQRAKQIPSEQDAFRRYYLNQWTAQESSWLDMPAWDACSAEVADSELQGGPAFFGLDLSSNIDLTALVAIIPSGDKLVLRNWNWLPEEGLLEREQRDRVPYRKWAKDGTLEFCPGSAIDLAFVTQRVLAIVKQFQVERISFDRWGSTSVSQTLTDEGLPMVAVGQGFASLSAPTKALQSAVLRKEIVHNGCPLLRWQAANCTVESDAAGNIKPVKKGRFRHRKHIDSIVAAIMAMDGVARGLSPSIADFLDNPITLG